MKVRDAVSDALRDLGVVALDEPLTMDSLAHGARVLDRMLRDWQGYGYCLWTKSVQSVPLVVGVGSYALPSRPVQILDVLYVDAAETPMERLSREEYDRLPNKATLGRPTCWHEVRGPAGSTLKIWPTPSAIASASVVYTREILDQESANADLDCPKEWRRAVVKNLAIELAPAYPSDVSLLMRQAGEALSLALGADREDSVFFS
ncbi:MULTISPECIES: hypothetical protein [Pseudomonadota]|uniref:phage adaptor protein n=1 Tax=Pseudomonadota TaxID=1224 RepID=UPI002616C625|nr:MULTISPECIES: hypothetical protein [Pseudomonadota]